MESLFRSLHFVAIMEDVMSWRESKKVNFSIRFLYREGPKCFFLVAHYLEALGCGEGVLFCLGVTWSRTLTQNQLKSWGWSITNRYYSCKEMERTFDCLILFSSKGRMLWNLIFSLFGVQWVLHSSVRGNLLGQNVSFCGQNVSFVGKKEVGVEGCFLILDVDLMEGKK